MPIGDFLPHDLIVYGRSGNCYKVQVKGTNTEARDTRRRNLRGRYRITAATGAEKTIISCANVDVLAAYVAPWDVWYIVPCEVITSKCVWLYPEVPYEESPQGKYEEYKNNWSIFEDKEGE